MIFFDFLNILGARARHGAHGAPARNTLRRGRFLGVMTNNIFINVIMIIRIVMIKIIDSV